MNGQHLTEHHSLNCYRKSNWNHDTPPPEIIQMSHWCSLGYVSVPVKMKFVDVFAGLGGFHLGLANSGSFECVFASELDEELRTLYKKNFNMDVHGDITNVDEKVIPKHDILCAGFPCQPFSLAGRKKGTKCPESGKLIDEVLRIADYHRPEFLLLENVPNILTISDGAFWRYIKKSFEILGYKLIFRVISPEDIGIPQNRKRIFILGSRQHKLLDQFMWPEVNSINKLSINDILEPQRNHRKLEQKKSAQLTHWQHLLTCCSLRYLHSVSIVAPEFGADYPVDFREKNLSEMRRYHGSYGVSLEYCESREELYRLLPSYARKSDRVPEWLLQSVKYSRELYENNRAFLTDWSRGFDKSNNSWQILEWRGYADVFDLSKHILQFRPSGIRVMKKERAPSLVAMTPTQIPIIGSDMRYMAKYEAARLQHLHKLQYMPDNDRKAFEAFGNAVNAKIVEMIADGIKAMLQQPINGAIPR